MEVVVESLGALDVDRRGVELVDLGGEVGHGGWGGGRVVEVGLGGGNLMNVW